MLASILRTVVPVIVGVLLTWAAKIGFNFTSDSVTAVVDVVVTGVYFWIARAIEQVWPALGSVLLSGGLTAKKPTYTTVKR